MTSQIKQLVHELKPLITAIRNAGPEEDTDFGDATYDLIEKIDDLADKLGDLSEERYDQTVDAIDELRQLSKDLAERIDGTVTTQPNRAAVPGHACPTCLQLVQHKGQFQLREEAV